MKTVTLTWIRDNITQDFAYLIEAAGGGVATFVAYAKQFFPTRGWTFVSVSTK